MLVSVIQLNSTEDVARNLTTAERLVREAASEGAELAVLPEKWPLLAGGAELEAGAQPLDGEIVTAARGWARDLGLSLLAGSFTERADDGGLPFNTSLLIGSGGEIEARYRKLHMFDVEVEGQAYEESAHERAGDELVVATAAELQLGMTVCYDLRFPELFRILALRGATAFSVPSAFTAHTGRAHWEVLLRARAIENAAYVFAAGQVGEAPPHYDSYGHSMIVDPWGQVLAGVDEGEGVATAELNLDELVEVRRTLPSLANRRADAYRWPLTQVVGA